MASGLENIETIESPFRRFVTTIGVFPTAFTDAMTYYECLAYLVKYLEETVIPAVNENAEALEELQTLYINLKSYVDNYFANLDVQEEINNKLDQMAKDGSLSAVLAVYVEPRLTELQDEISTETINRRNADSNLQNQINVIADRPTISPAVPTKTSQLINDSGFVKGESYSVHGSGSEFNMDDTSNDKLIVESVFGDLAQEGTPDLGTPADIDVVTGTQTVNISGKNMFDINTLQATNITVVDGVATGTSGAFNIAFGDSTSGIPIPNYTGEAGSIGISATAYTDGNATTQATTGLYINVFYTDNTSENALLWSNSDTTPVRKTFVTNSDKTVAKICINFQNNASNIWHLSKFQIEKGGVSDFADYVGQTLNVRLGSLELAGYSNKVDYIYTDGTDFYKHALIGKVILNGSETWTKSNVAFQTLATTTPNRKQSATLVGYSNYFVYHYYPSAISSNIQDGEFGWSGSNILTMRNDDCADATAFQTWLGTHNTSVYYVLDTATDTKITDSDLIDDLEALWNAMGGSVETNIKVTCTSGLPAGLIVSQYVNRYAPATNTRIGGVIIGEGIEVTPNGTISVPSASEIFNSAPYLATPAWTTGAKAYDAKLNVNHQNIEAFTFFTDPHLAGENGIEFSERTNKWIGTLQKYYNSTPQNFIVCGGDWLNSDNDLSDVCFKLGYVDGFMNSMFKNYYGLVGNHDKDTHGAGVLPQSTINNLMYRKEGKAYYSFDGVNTKCYCLDNGDATDTMNTYRWNQIDWLANQLITDNPEHAIVFTHVIWNVIPGGYSLISMTDNVTKLIAAYNSHTTITLNSQTYDFSACTGKVHYVLGGHTHYDHTDTVNGVLCIVTATFGASIQSQPTFDMIVNDYTAGKAYFNRIGNGSSTEYNI